MNRNPLLFLTALLLTMATPVLASNDKGAVTLSPFFGGEMFPGGKEHLDSDFKWGVRLGYNFTPNLGTELVFGKVVTLHDPEVISCRVYQYGADMLYHFRPEKRLVPFLAAGFGAMTVDYDHGISDDTSPYFGYGAGVQYSLADWIALRSDIRHSVTMDNGDSALEATVGLKFQFGYAPKSPSTSLE